MQDPTLSAAPAQVAPPPTEPSPEPAPEPEEQEEHAEPETPEEPAEQEAAGVNASAAAKVKAAQEATAREAAEPEPEPEGRKIHPDDVMGREQFTARFDHCLDKMAEYRRTGRMPRDLVAAPRPAADSEAEPLSPFDEARRNGARRARSRGNSPKSPGAKKSPAAPKWQYEDGEMKRREPAPEEGCEDAEQDAGEGGTEFEKARERQKVRDHRHKFK